MKSLAIQRTWRPTATIFWVVSTVFNRLPETQAWFAQQGEWDANGPVAGDVNTLN